jgi:hypothetical protein
MFRQYCRQDLVERKLRTQLAMQLGHEMAGRTESVVTLMKVIG